MKMMVYNLRDNGREYDLFIEADNKIGNED